MPTIAETGDLFDDNGKWIGAVDRNGREQTVLTAQQQTDLAGGGLPALIGANNQLGSSSLVSEVAMYTLALPAGTLGANDALVVEPVFRFTGANGTRTLRVKIGATLGTATTVWSAAHASTVLSTQPYIRLRGRNSLTSQVASWATNTGNGSALGYGSSSTDLTFTTIDFSVATNIYVTIQLASASDVAEHISTWVQVQRCVV